MTLPCFACGKKLLAAIKKNTNNQPSGAVCFRAPGQYGSRLFDPMNDNEYIEVNICDACLKKNAKKALYYVKHSNTVESFTKYIKRSYDTSPDLK